VLVGSTIGSGIFRSPAGIADKLPGPLPLLAIWAGGGLFVLCGALTLAELAVGVGLLLGIATRLAAVGGLLLILPIWIMLWHTTGYLWEYPLDLFPLVLLAIVPAGRVLGVDRLIAARFRHWPF